jgi:hypothetical protein
MAEAEGGVAKGIPSLLDGLPIKSAGGSKDVHQAILAQYG